MESGFPLPRAINRRIWRAVTEFGLINPGDRVLVGFSGGKDSAFLLHALRSLQHHNRLIPFTLAAVTLDPGFVPDFPPASMAAFAADLGVEWFAIETRIGDLIADGKDPCARCSHMRRGAICRFAREHGFNKVALAHHHDDAVETFLMSILYSGQIRVFQPLTALDGGLAVIRPLVYLREAEVREHLPLTGFTPVAGGCPFEGKTHRKKVKELIHGLCGENRFVYDNLTAAMRAGNEAKFWPPPPGGQEMRRRLRKYFSPGG